MAEWGDPNQVQIKAPGSDLLSQVPKRRMPSAPPGFYKSLGLDFVIVIFSAGAGVVFREFLAGALDFVWVVVSFGALTALSILGSFLAKSMGRRILNAAVQSVAFLIPFIGAPLDLLAIGFGAMFILLIWGDYLARDDAENSVEIRFFRMVKRPLSKTLSALTLVAVILYIPVWGKENTFLSEASFNSVFALTTRFVSGLYPEYRFNSNLGDFAKSVVQGQLQKDAQFNLLPPAVRAKVLDDASAKLLEGMSGAAGIQLDPAATFSGVAYNFLNKSLTDLKVKYGTLFVTLWALAVFLTVRGLSALLGFLIAFLAFILYHAMISMRLIRVRTENKPHEIVEFF